MDPENLQFLIKTRVRYFTKDITQLSRNSTYQNTYVLHRGQMFLCNKQIRQTWMTFIKTMLFPSQKIILGYMVRDNHPNNLFC